jgi:hypothetical protein
MVRIVVDDTLEPRRIHAAATSGYTKKELTSSYCSNSVSRVIHAIYSEANICKAGFATALE